jgi:hypothetical protein
MKWDVLQSPRELRAIQKALYCMGSFLMPLLLSGRLNGGVSEALYCMGHGTRSQLVLYIGLKNNLASVNPTLQGNSCSQGLQVRKFASSYVCKFVGLQVRRLASSSVRKFVGLQVRKFESS